jgi:hypothetical protein
MRRPSRKPVRPTTAASRRNGAKRSRKPLPLIAQADVRALAQTRARIDAFAKQHPDFDDLAGQIELLLRVSHFDLEEAYHLAAFMRHCALKSPRRAAIKRALAKHG